MDRHNLWQAVYQDKAEQQTSWFRPHLDESLRLIDGLDLDKDLPVIDVGAGRSTLVDDLLARGFMDLTILDLSQAALDQSRDRLGERGGHVLWLTADITSVELSAEHYQLWHDRALLHFLTQPAERNRYIDAATRSIRIGGYAILATFAPDGPDKCSGQRVDRYDGNTLAGLFAANFECIGHTSDIHPTPFGTEQAFTYIVLRRRVHNGHEATIDMRNAHTPELKKC